MNRNKWSLFFVCLLVSLAGCSVAPVNNTTTARSLGEKNQQIKGSAPVFGLIYERGLSSKFDMGVGIEEQVGHVFQIYGKYAFINNQEKGFSFAEVIGGSYGASFANSKAIFFSPVLSYRHDWFEVFTAYRINYVRWSNNLSGNKKDDLLSFIPSKTTFHYHQMDLGFNFINDKITTTVGAKVFIFDKNSSATPFLDIGYKF